MHEQVEASELFHRCLNDRAGRLDVRNVAVHFAGGEDVPTLLFQARGDRRADSAGSSGDEGPHEGPNCKEFRLSCKKLIWSGIFHPDAGIPFAARKRSTNRGFSAMKKALLLGVSLLAAVSASVALAAVAVTRVVAIKPDGFSPVTRTIQTGDAIRWRNDDTVNHQVVADNGHFASPVLRPRQTYQRTFNTAGTFRYRDALEPAERARSSSGARRPRSRSRSRSRLCSTGRYPPHGVHLDRGGQPGRFRLGADVRFGLVRQAGRPEDRHLWRVRLHRHPQLLSDYQVRWGSRLSAIVTVGVRPRMTFIRRAPWFVTSAKAATPLAGRWVYVQRRSSLGQWVNRKKVRLGSSGPGGSSWTCRAAGTSCGCS